jgi:hypothetical protein
MFIYGMEINVNIYKQLKEKLKKMQCVKKVQNANVQVKCNV